MKSVKKYPLFSEWSLILWVSAVILAVFAFSGLAGTASLVVQILILAFAILFVLSSIFRSQPPH